MLRPGVEGMSETIRVRSVLGRFLEHSRVFVFERPEQSNHFIGSADLMPRNLDHRIEIVTPVEQLRAQSELNAMFDTLLADNSTAWQLAPDGSWERLKPKKNQRATGCADCVDAPRGGSRAPAGRLPHACALARYCSGCGV